MRPVRIGGRLIGLPQPCYVIAEAGSNHDGSLEQARALVDVAAEAGADAVKFQVFRADRMYPPSAGVTDYLNDPTPIYDIISRLEMPEAWVPQLARHCRTRSVTFLASVFDEDAADRIDPYVEAFKIASYEMTHLPLVQHVARKGKPVIISTGAATIDEVADTVTAFRATGNRDLILMQCTAAYPAPVESLNLRAMDALRDRFDVPAGFSDHSRDPLVGPLAAVARGAAVLEKHFTLSNALPGPDHQFAIDPAELRLMVEKIRQVERALGSGEKAVELVEEELRAFARRSVFATREIAAGEIFTTENAAVLRCGKLPAGLSPREYPGLLGRRAVRSIVRDSAIRATDAE